MQGDNDIFDQHIESTCSNKLNVIITTELFLLRIETHMNHIFSQQHIIIVIYVVGVLIS